MSLEPVELLCRLIQIPSVNAMGHEVTGPHIGEGRLTDFLQSRCEELGLPWLRQRVHPGRDNLFCVLRGNPLPIDGGELLLWDVHQDTVPVEGMTVEPFGGEIREGRVYGRGSSDVKGSMAAMLAAIGQASKSDRLSSTSPTIVVVFTVNEECGFTGVKAACDLLDSTRSDAPNIVGGTISPEEVFPRRPDGAIVAEPTNFDVVVAHQGVMRWRCHTIGRAAHTSRPELGVNSIYGMSQVVQAIERHNSDLARSELRHPLCGSPKVCVSTIHGGVAVNTVPERTTIEIDRRLGPEESPHTAYDELVQVVSQVDVGRCRIDHEPAFMDSYGLSDKNNHALAGCLASLMQRFNRQNQAVGVPYATDAAAIAATGIPTVVFGPGSIDQAHTSDEFIEIAELQLATEVFREIAMNDLGSKSGSRP
jgi:acetylornithine deacetylase